MIDYLSQNPPDTILEERGPGRRLGQGQQHGQPGQLLSRGPVCLNEPARNIVITNSHFPPKLISSAPVKLRVLAGQGDAEHRGDHPGGHLGQLLARDALLHLPGQLEVLEHGGGVEQVVAALPEDERQLLVVVGHHLGLEGLLGQRHESVDVLDCLVGLLPELHLDGGVQLDQPRVQVPLLSLGAVEVDRVGRRVLLLDDQIQMIPQFVTELPELGLALILQTEPEQYKNFKQNTTQMTFISISPVVKKKMVE